MSEAQYSWRVLRERLGEENWQSVAQMTDEYLGFSFDSDDIDEATRQHLVGTPIFYTARHLKIPVVAARLLAEETIEEPPAVTESGRRVWTIEQALDEADFWYRHTGRQKEANTAAYEAVDPRALRVCACLCGSPRMRDGMNVVLLRRPPHMYPTKKGDFIEVDRCVAPVVEWVWSQGVWTGGACCGHTQARPTIAPMDDSIELMRQLGYEAHEDAPHIFYVDRINEVRP